jgi:hypothetical protein
MQPRYLAATLLVTFAVLALACGGYRGPRQPVADAWPKDDLPPKDEQPPRDRPGGGPKDAPKDSPKDGPGGGPKVEGRDPAKEMPDFVWTTAELRKEFGNNNPLYRQKYADKIIEVSGTVYEFDPFAYYAPSNAITIQIESKPSFFYLHMQDREPWARAVPGQPVKLRGRVARKDEFINEPLVQCVIVEPQQSPALQLTAEQLCREARAEPKKYVNQYMIVSGVVTAKSKVNALYLEIKGDDQSKVRCQIVDKLKFTIDPIMVGQKVKVFGQFVTATVPDLPGTVILGKALPITKDVQ